VTITPSAAAALFREQAAKRILVTDGAFGTMVQAYNLDEAAYRGSIDTGFDQKGNNDLLSLTRPDIVREITDAYLAAGSDIVCTNTFNANRISTLPRRRSPATLRMRRSGRPACRASSRARSGRPTRHCRYRPMSMIRAFAPLPSTN
jgi:5-methyltetrahydrofolate--homocysteine methyltransferase